MTPLWSSLWQFSTSNVMADPGTRHVRWNDDAAPTQMAISVTDDDGTDRQAQLMALAVGQVVLVRSTSTAGDWGALSITALPVDLATWIKLDVALDESGTNSTPPVGNERLLLDFVVMGGATPTPITAEDVFKWMGTPSPSAAATESMAKVVAAVVSNAAKTHTVPDPDDPDYDLALTMMSARLWKRKSSPEGVIASSEFGAIRVTKFDSDIERMLDPYANLVVG